MTDEDASKGRFAHENLCSVWAAVRLAQEMGEGLGQGPVLLGPVPREMIPCALTVKVDQ